MSHQEAAFPIFRTADITMDSLCPPSGDASYPRAKAITRSAKVGARTRSFSTNVPTTLFRVRRLSRLSLNILDDSLRSRTSHRFRRLESLDSCLFFFLSYQRVDNSWAPMISRSFISAEIHYWTVLPDITLCDSQDCAAG
jgi:hypothetical protein